MIASTFPAAANCTALAAAASLCSVLSISHRDKSIPASRAADSILANGPIKMGIINPALTASTTASSTLACTGWTTAVRIAGISRQASIC
jgi:hypothetical protein